MAFVIQSPAFAEGATIPRKYTLDGENLSPPLSWSDPPRSTRSFAILCEDPDAPSGVFRHWAMCNIGANLSEVPEGAGGNALGHDVVVARNDFGHQRYDGPRPPKGHGVHHYHFRIAALDTDHIDAAPSQSAEDLWRTVQPHVLAQTETVGTYER